MNPKTNYNHTHTFRITIGMGFDATMHPIAKVLKEKGTIRPIEGEDAPVGTPITMSLSHDFWYDTNLSVQETLALLDEYDRPLSQTITELSDTQQESEQ